LIETGKRSKILVFRAFLLLLDGAAIPITLMLIFWQASLIVCGIPFYWSSFQGGISNYAQISPLAAR